MIYFKNDSPIDGLDEATPTMEATQTFIPNQEYNLVHIKKIQS